MQELGKFSLKINAILNDLVKYMSFRINSKLSFIDSLNNNCQAMFEEQLPSKENFYSSLTGKKISVKEYER